VHQKGGKNMKKILIKASLVLLLIFGMAANASALPLMTGGVSFSGNDAVDTGNVLTATKFTSFSGVTITTGSGTWLGAGGTSATFAPFTFSPPSNVTGLWSFTFGGVTYSLNALSSTMTFSRESGDIPALDVTGTGTIFASTGFDPTPGAYKITAQQGDVTFSFSSSSKALPEPLTLILLGSGLLGLACLRRKLS
jgi:hypothetical protein